MKNNDLENENIGKLICKYSIPCVISMIVAALYNIVDQIFIGWSEAGAYGNAATNIVYPFTVFALGIALLIGDGTAAELSISLGKGDKKKVSRIVMNGIMLLVVLSVIICAIGFSFRNNILLLFGGNPLETECYNFATEYYKIICVGIPFYMIGQGLNGSIRADGSPKYAMTCTLAGAIINLIFDPILIFAFSMGVKGAAIATVLGQIFTFILSLIYLTKAKNFSVNIKELKIDKKIITNIILVGMASLIVQLSIVIIISVNNNLLTKYGYETFSSTGVAFGAVIPLAVVGIVMKVFGIVVSIVIGISLGGQPIIGFNMGANNIERVKETIKIITKTVLIVGTIAFLIFEIMPDAIILLFGSHNTIEYMEYARLCIRIFLGGIILTCYIKSSSIILQSMGNSIKSTVLALLRDVIIFVPASIIIAVQTKNIVMLLWAAIISDIIATIIGWIFVQTEIIKCKKIILK